MAALRQCTADQHRSIESVLALDSPFDLRHYRRVLRGFGVFHAAWEPRVAAALPAADAAWFIARSRRPLLQRDLQALLIELPLPVAGPSRIPLDDRASAWGSMYVLEGSALGGQLIARRLVEQLGIRPDRGGAYFHGWGSETGAMWRKFRERLEQEVGSDPAAMARACHAAGATFDALTDVFRMVLDEPVVA